LQDFLERWGQEETFIRVWYTSDAFQSKQPQRMQLAGLQKPTLDWTIISCTQVNKMLPRWNQ